MPIYATLPEMLERFDEAELVQLTDVAGAGVVDQLSVDAACARASGLIDGYLASAYRLPLSPVPPQLVDLCCDIARRLLYRVTPPDDVEKRHAAALKLLKDIAAGTFKLDQGVEQLPARPDVLLADGPPPVFGRDSMRGY